MSHVNICTVDDEGIIFLCPKVLWARAGRQTPRPGWWCPKSRVGGGIALLMYPYHEPPLHERSCTHRRATLPPTFYHTHIKMLRDFGAIFISRWKMDDIFLESLQMFNLLNLPRHLPSSIPFPFFFYFYHMSTELCIDHRVKEIYWFMQRGRLWSVLLSVIIRQRCRSICCTHTLRNMLTHPPTLNPHMSASFPRPQRLGELMLSSCGCRVDITQEIILLWIKRKARLHVDTCWDSEVGVGKQVRGRRWGQMSRVNLKPGHVGL